MNEEEKYNELQELRYKLENGNPEQRKTVEKEKKEGKNEPAKESTLKKTDYNITATSEERKTIATALKGIGFVEIALGIIAAIICASVRAVLNCILCLAAGTITGIMFFGFAEIITLLERILDENYRNTYLMTAQMSDILRSLNEIKDK